MTTRPVPDARAALNLMRSVAAFADQPERLARIIAAELLRHGHGPAARAEHIANLIARQAARAEGSP